MKKRIIGFIVLVAILLPIFAGETVSVQAVSVKEKKYTYENCIKFAKKCPAFSTLRLRQDSHGYYAVYDCGGQVEKYLGRTKKDITFSKFAELVGDGKTYKNTKYFKVTKKERELKKMAVGVLAAYICAKAGTPWLASYVIGYIGDSKANAILRKPGKYRQITCTSEMKEYNAAVGDYMSTNYFFTVSKLQKYNKKKKKWINVWCETQPKFMC